MSNNQGKVRIVNGDGRFKWVMPSVAANASAMNGSGWFRQDDPLKAEQLPESKNAIIEEAPVDLDETDVDPSESHPEPDQVPSKRGRKPNNN